MNNIGSNYTSFSTGVLRSLLVVALALAIAGTYAVAQNAAPPAEQKPLAQRQVEYRQAVFTVLAGNFAPLGQVAGGKAPYDSAEVQLRASRVLAMAGMVSDGFPESSKEFPGSKAKSEIWTESAKFAAAVKELQSKTGALSQLVATDGTNSAAFQKAVADVGGTCKGCHDEFRNR
jgi:cytochrome c556